MENTRWNGGPTFLLITGASKGLGQAFAIALSKELSEGSVVVLTARSTEGLNETKNKIKESDGRIAVDLIQMDHCSDSTKAVRELIEKHKNVKLRSAVLVHNAGTIGKQGVTVADYDEEETITSYLRLNYTSPCLINSVFLQSFGPDVKRTVVNISSLCGVVPFPTWANYCSIKAAREMFFQVMAKEFPDVRILSFAPGPNDTALAREVKDDPHTNETIKQSFKDRYENKTILQPIQAAERLVGLLNKDAFKSGSRIDYYDED